jgi:hypothetical protein
MTLGKHWPWLLGPTAAAALLVAAFATVAQATLIPQFLINKKALSFLQPSFSPIQLGRGTLLIPSLDTEINCEKFTVYEGKINSGTDADTKLLYEECTTLEMPEPIGKSKELSECEIIVSEASKDFRHHITASALLLPTELTSGEPAILAEKINALILFLKGKECILPLEKTVKGELCLAIDNNDTVEPTVLANQVIQEKECKERPALEATGEGAGFKDKLTYVGAPAFPDATARAFLTGEHKGLTLGTSLVTQVTTMLCKAKEGSCEPYGLGSKILASLEKDVKFVFPYEGETLEPSCKVSTMSGTTTKEGETLIGELTALEFKECGGGLCTVVPQHLPYKFEVKPSTMTWSSGGGGGPSFAIKCLGSTKCIYGATVLPLTIAGGSPAKLSSSGVTLIREEGSEEACGITGAKWEGTAEAEGKIQYKITSPNPLFVRLI